MEGRAEVHVRAIGPYESWFVAQVTLGLVYVGGAMFLLPGFVLSLPDSDPGDVGIVMAVLPLIALGAPIVGGLLDRFGSYRLFQNLGLGLFAVGFGVLALADELIATTLGALILGVGAALVMTTNLSMLAGSGLPEDDLTARMSLLQMSVPVGQVLGLAIVAGLLAIELEFGGLFLVMAALSLIGLGFTAATNGPAAQRALDQRAGMRADAGEEGEEPDRGLGWVLWSTFGLVLLVVFVSMVSHATIESQYPNYMNDVFGIDGDLAAVALAVAVLVSIPLYPAIGQWARRVALRVPLLLGVAGRGVAGLALWLVADVSGLPVLVPLLLYGAIMIMLPLTDTTGALLAATTSPIGPGGGQGGYGFALAAAAVGGAFLAGWAASEFGYRSLALIVAILALVAVALGLGIPKQPPTAMIPRTPSRTPTELP
jgi:MFS family permease